MRENGGYSPEHPTADESITNNEKNNRIKDFYFTIVKFNTEGITRKPDENDHSFNNRKMRREQQVARALQGILEELGVDASTAAGLNQVRAFVGEQLTKQVATGSPKDQARTRRNVAKFFGVSPDGSQDDLRGPNHTRTLDPEIKKIGLAKLTARGDAEALLQLMRLLRYELSEREVGFIKAIADRNKIIPLLQLALSDDRKAANSAKKNLKNFYGITGSDEVLKRIIEEKNVAAMHAEDELELIFGIAGLEELLKKIEKA
jgi:hypothetical protein